MGRGTATPHSPPPFGASSPNFELALTPLAGAAAYTVHFVDYSDLGYEPACLAGSIIATLPGPKPNLIGCHRGDSVRKL